MEVLYLDFYLYFLFIFIFFFNIFFFFPFFKGIFLACIFYVGFEFILLRYYCGGGWVLDFRINLIFLQINLKKIYTI